MDATIQFNVNGQQRTVTTDPERPLLDVLREDLQLTGAKYGCGEGRCGACSVLVEGRRVFSCTTAVAKVEGKKLLTIEGLSPPGGLHPVQEAFLECGAYQCGYCTPGMILTAVALLAEKPNASDAEIGDGMNRNLCRCCGYPNITEAVKRAAGRGEEVRQ